MTEDDLTLVINSAFAVYREKWLANDRMSQAQIQFILAQSERALTRLREIGQTIRSTQELKKFPATTEAGEPIIFGSVRSIMAVHDSLLAEGQVLKRFLWSGGGLDNTLDLISYYYGVSFNALKIHQVATRNSDGKRVYVLTNPKDNWPSISLAIDGQWTAVPRESLFSDFTLNT